MIALCRPILVLVLVLGLWCVAAQAGCAKPSVRREWRSLSKAERADWISAVKCLANLPHTDALTPTVKPNDIPPVNVSGSYYDDFVYMHMDLNIKIHSTGLFLPWHRWYVHVYETALKSKCGFKGTSPYWDWSIDAPDMYHGTIFQDPDPVSGLGGWGDPTRDFQVPSGGFSISSSFKLSYPSPHSLRRNFTLQPFLNFPLPGFVSDPAHYANASFTKGEVRKLVNGFVGDYKAFQTYFEAILGAHSCVHLIMGGDLGGTCPSDAPPGCIGGPTFSANEPMFWLHHAMVDKVWYDWQHHNKANARAFQGGSVQHLENATIFEMYPTGGPPYLNLGSMMPSDGMFPQAAIADVIDTRDGILCYAYDS